MLIEIEIEQETVAKVDEAIKVLEEKREDVFREAIRDLAKKKQREAEVRRAYAKAYRKNPVQPDEFDVDEEQLIEAWKDL